VGMKVIYTNEYFEIFCGLLEPFPRLRALENYVPIGIKGDVLPISQSEILTLTKLERDYYKRKYEMAKEFLHKLLADHIKEES
jgi:hypothetical protein